MTNRLSHRIIALSMAMLLLLTSTGFSMDVHYCQDQLRGVSLIGESKCCSTTQETSPCLKAKVTTHNNPAKAEMPDKTNCCQNKTLVIDKSDVDAASPQLAITQECQLEFVAAYVAVYVLNYNQKSPVQTSVPYKPPFPDRDVQVFYQSFLIWFIGYPFVINQRDGDLTSILLAIFRV